MDEEDLAAVKEEQTLAATEDFSALGSTESFLSGRERRPESLAATLEDLVVPSSDKQIIGLRLLRTMGWRDGQGLGPLISYERHIREWKSAAPALDDDEADADIHAQKHQFAPRDVPVVSFRAKTDRFGLGYDSYRGFPGPISQLREAAMASKSKERIPMAGILRTSGLEADVDEDVFAAIDEPELSKATRVAGRDLAAPIASIRGFRQCHDGRPPLHRFLLTSVASKIERWFAPPVLPPDYIPKRAASSTPGSVAIAGEPPKAAAVGLPKDADKESLSIMDMLPEKERRRLRELKQSIREPPKALPAASPSAGVEKSVAQAALKGFMPFQDDPLKQARYRRFLEVHAGIEPSASPGDDAKSGIEFERQRESDEFARAANIFRPLSSAMASRFVSASSESSLPAAEQLLASKQMVAPATERPPRRSDAIWRPARLLCKRLNIANPYPDDPDPGADLEEGALGERENEARAKIFGSMSATTPLPSASLPASAPMFGSEDSGPDVGSLNIEHSSADGKDPILDYERPEIDLFKAIFEDAPPTVAIDVVPADDDDGAPSLASALPLVSPVPETPAPLPRQAALEYRKPTLAGRSGAFESSASVSKSDTQRVRRPEPDDLVIGPEKRRMHERARDDPHAPRDKPTRDRRRIETSDPGKIANPARAGSSSSSDETERTRSKARSARKRSKAIWVEKPPSSFGNGNSAANPPATRSMSSATPTKAIPARSWTGC